jgi:hypothetical protein
MKEYMREGKNYYNYGRPHQVLDYQFPVEAYFRDFPSATIKR